MTISPRTPSPALRPQVRPGRLQEPNPTQGPSRWLRVFQPRPGARARLVCFHHAGGGASMYRGFAGALGPEVEVCAVQLPGREERLAEPPFTRLEPLLEALEAELAPALVRPYALFGHSMGAMIALELARRMAGRGEPGPALLLLAGASAPGARVRDEPIHDLPEEAFRAALRRYGGTPAEVLANDELMEIYSPLLRADFAVGEASRSPPRPPLACPIVALAGDDDPIVPVHSMEPYAAVTRGSFRLHVLRGGHFFVRGADEGLLAIVRAELAPAGLVSRP